MARPVAALDAIKELQTILDDERDAIAGGTHLKLCNAALAVYNEVKAFAGEKRKREGEDPGSDSDDDDDVSDDDYVHGEDVDEDSLSGHELFYRWTRMLIMDGGGFLFDRMLRNLMGRSEVDDPIEEHELDHARRRAAAWAIAKATKNRLLCEEDGDTWITSDSGNADSVSGRESVAMIKEWVHAFVTDGALLYCIEVLDNGERGSNPEETGIAPDQDPRVGILNVLHNFCSFDVAFRRKMATARAVETLKYIAVHTEGGSELSRMAESVFLRMEPYNPDLEVWRNARHLISTVPRKKPERDMEIEELADIWTRQVLEEVRSLYDVIEFTDDHRKTDKEHVAAFMAMGKVLVSARNPEWDERLLMSAMYHMQQTGCGAVVKQLQHGFYWDAHPGLQMENDPRLAALTALMAAFNAPWACLGVQKKEIVKQFDLKNGRRFLRMTTRKHGTETRLGRLCHLVSQELAIQEQA